MSFSTLNKIAGCVPFETVCDKTKMSWRLLLSKLFTLLWVIFSPTDEFLHSYQNFWMRGFWIGVFVPRLLNNEQLDHQVQLCTELQEAARYDPNFLSRVITGDDHGCMFMSRYDNSIWKFIKSLRKPTLVSPPLRLETPTQVYACVVHKINNMRRFNKPNKWTVIYSLVAVTSKCFQSTYFNSQS